MRCFESRVILMLGMLLVVKYIESLDTGSTPLGLLSHLYRVGKIKIIVKDQQQVHTSMDLPSVNTTIASTHICVSSRNSGRSQSPNCMRIRRSQFDLSWRIRRWDVLLEESVQDTLAIIMALTPNKSTRNGNVDMYICWDEISI